MGDINFVNGVVTNEEWRGVVDAFQLTQVITPPTRVTATTYLHDTPATCYSQRGWRTLCQ